MVSCGWCRRVICFFSGWVEVAGPLWIGEPLNYGTPDLALIWLAVVRIAPKQLNFYVICILINFPYISISLMNRKKLMLLCYRTLYYHRGQHDAFPSPLPSLITLTPKK